eukprot:1083507-Heterocapsa_arctica.AAC.1
MSPLVTGDGQGVPWTTLPNQPFDGYALYHVLQYIERHCAYPPVELANDGEGNINNLIRVDHGHYNSLLAEESYELVNAENMMALLRGEEFLVFMANAR